MPLFGPNINKMKEKGDVEGLSKLLNDSKMRTEAIKALIELGSIERLSEALSSKNAGVRVQVAEALKDISNPVATDALNKALISALKFGEMEEEVEAITLIQGRGPEHFLSAVVANETAQALKSVSRKLSLDTFRDALLGVVQQHKEGATVWYALIALVELGDRGDEVLNRLAESSHAYINALETTMDGPAPSALIAWVVGTHVCEETLRALSHFRGSSKALDVIAKAYEGSYLSSPRITGRQEHALYALAALGDPSCKERLEYLVSHGKAPNVVIELFGKAGYDEIKARSGKT
jgi:hypothetical protein